MQINREWERTVASNWSGFIGTLSVSKSISFGHLLRLWPRSPIPLISLPLLLNLPSFPPFYGQPQPLTKCTQVLTWINEGLLFTVFQLNKDFSNPFVRLSYLSIFHFAITKKYSNFYFIEERFIDVVGSHSNPLLILNHDLFHEKIASFSKLVFRFVLLASYGGRKR